LKRPEISAGTPKNSPEMKDDRQGTFRHRLSHFDPKYVSLQAPAYGWLQLPLVEPNLTAPILQYVRRVFRISYVVGEE
jgi:hypothetical protein